VSSAESVDRPSKAKLKPSTGFRVLVAASLLAFSSEPASPQSQQDALQGKNTIKGEHGADVVEQIYVARSTRVSNTVPPTAFCDSAPFKAVRESYLIWSSIATQPEDGRLSNPAVKKIGYVKTCVGPRETQDPSFAVVRLYTEGTIAGVAFKGIGNCQIQANLPESGISQLRCFQSLSGLPNGYTGGALLNNAIISQNETGDVTSPPGYLQSGIATFRLWKKRAWPVK
jgi:hypothetical protein